MSTLINKNIILISDLCIDIINTDRIKILVYKDYTKMLTNSDKMKIIFKNKHFKSLSTPVCQI